MLLHGDDDITYLGDDVIQVSPLSDISRELLEETILTQINDPYTAVVDCLAEFEESYEEEMEDENNSDMVKQNNDIADNFYTRVVIMLNEKYNLDIDMEVFAESKLETKRNIAEALYEFFILKYVDNISNFIINMIMNNIDSIIDYLKSSDAVNNSAMISYKKKTKKKEYAVLLANINIVIGCVKTLEIEPEDFTDYFNIDRFSVSVIKYLIEHDILNGNFISSFLGPILDRVQDDIYDRVVTNVHIALYNKFSIDEDFDVTSLLVNNEEKKEDE